MGRISRLFFMNGPNEGESFEINGKAVYLGRSSESDVQVKDQFVSRRHLQIKQKRNRFFIKDLKSKNGTLVNGALIKSGRRMEVPEGIPIVIGMSVFCLGRECPEDIPGLLRSIGIDKDTSQAFQDPLAYRGLESESTQTFIYRLSHVLKRSLGIGGDT